MSEVVLYGPTFARDLAEAGGADLPISWSSTEIFGRGDLTPEQDAIVAVAIASHDPEAQIPRQIPRLAFFRQIARDGKFHDFLTWRDAQDADTIIYFLEEPAFSEDDAEVDAAMTALSLTKGAFVTSALDP